MSNTDVIEGTAEEVDAKPEGTTETHDIVHTEPIPTELVPRPTREALVPLDAESVVAGMTAYQELLPKLLNKTDYQTAGRDKDGNEKRFVKKSGWRKIARAFNLSVEIREVTVIRDEAGEPIRAESIARAIAPNGQVQDGDGYCSIDEDRFSGPRGNKSKLENDLRTTATTRAKNRAISDLVGMGEVSAEEVDGGAGGRVTEATADLKDAASKAIVTLAGHNAAKLSEKVLAANDGKLPAAVATALVYAAAANAALHPVEEPVAS